jgi:hypothetical protein
MRFPKQSALIGASLVLSSPLAYSSTVKSLLKPALAASYRQEKFGAVSATGVPTLFVAPFGRRIINFFDANLHQLGSIAAPGGAIVSDMSRNIYDLRYDLTHIDIYGPPYNKSPEIIALPGSEKVRGLAVDSRTGVLAILGCRCGRLQAIAIINFYRPGHTTPCNTLTPSLIQGSGGSAAFDREGTLFFQSANGGNIGIYSVANECQATTVTPLTFTNPIYPYGQIFVNKDDNIVIQSYGSPPALLAANALPVTNSPWPIYTYAHPINGVFAAPIATTVLQQYGKNIDAPEQMWGMGSDGKTLWGASDLRAGLRLFKYPAGGPSLQTIDTPPGWVAVVPPLIP